MRRTCSAFLSNDSQRSPHCPHTLATPAPVVLVVIGGWAKIQHCLSTHSYTYMHIYNPWLGQESTCTLVDRACKSIKCKPMHTALALCIAECLNTNELAAYPAPGGWLARPSYAHSGLSVCYCTSWLQPSRCWGLGPGNEGCGRGVAQ